MIEHEVINILSKTVGIEKGEVTLDTEIRSLGVTSMKIVEVILKIEKKYDIVIPDNATYKIKTTRELVDLVQRLCDEAEVVHENSQKVIM